MAAEEKEEEEEDFCHIVLYVDMKGVVAQNAVKVAQEGSGITLILVRKFEQATKRYSLSHLLRAATGNKYTMNDDDDDNKQRRGEERR